MRESDLTLTVTGEAAMEALGGALADAVRPLAGGRHLLVLLHGELGAGKTTLVRGLLRRLGHRGRVPSPTYTLLEPYRPSAGFAVHHLDLYRLSEAEELDHLGWRDESAEPGLSLVEWPDRVPWLAGRAQLALHIRGDGASRELRFVPRDDELAGRLHRLTRHPFGSVPE